MTPGTDTVGIDEGRNSHFEFQKDPIFRGYSTNFLLVIDRCVRSTRLAGTIGSIVRWSSDSKNMTIRYWHLRVIQICSIVEGLLHGTAWWGNHALG
jgi:hypothetical protein